MTSPPADSTPADEQKHQAIRKGELPQIRRRELFGHRAASENIVLAALQNDLSP